MKLLIIVSVLALGSCTKDWECCVEGTTTHTDPALIQLNGTSTYCIDFRGTNQEKNEFEADGTKVSDIGYGGTLDLVTTCVPD